MHITCPRGFGIDIIIGVYGIRNKESCNYPKDKVINCTAGDKVFKIIKETCNQKQQCRLQATSDVFNNNCSGSGRELKVVHRCLRHVDVLKALACENEKMQLECSPGYIIKIVNTFYGRKNQLTCHEQSRSSDKCLNIEAMDTMLNRCEGVQTCIVSANEEEFEDPKLWQHPCKNSSKYLEVDYLCESG
uniref:SUEL-type lectin domain-containing protein n=1 Tax=Rhodnius prolixus TaxID=13249 RepID=T1HH62_RHOPR